MHLAIRYPRGSIEPHVTGATPLPLSPFLPPPSDDPCGSCPTPPSIPRHTSYSPPPRCESTGAGRKGLFYVFLLCIIVSIGCKCNDLTHTPRPYALPPPAIPSLPSPPLHSTNPAATCALLLPTGSANPPSPTTNLNLPKPISLTYLLLASVIEHHVKPDASKFASPICRSSSTLRLICRRKMCRS